MKYHWLFWVVPVGAILASLLLAEVGLRVVATAMNKVRGATFDSELGWRLVPDISKMDFQWCGDVPATTNLAGWRDAEFSIEKPVGVTRILALGDSFTFGFGVDYGQRFSEYQEESSPSLEVLNMGVFAYATDQELLVYELHGKQYQPSITLLNVYLGNDIKGLQQKKVHGWPKPYFTLEGDQLGLVKPIQSKSIYLRTHSYIAELVFQVLERGDKLSAVADELLDADLDALFFSLVAKLDQATSAEDVRLLVVLHHPREATVKERAHHERIAKELISQGRMVLDLYSVFAGQEKLKDGFYLPNGHLNPSGHQLAAQAIRKELLAREWISP